MGVNGFGGLTYTAAPLPKGHFPFLLSCTFYADKIHQRAGKKTSPRPLLWRGTLIANDSGTLFSRNFTATLTKASLLTTFLTLNVVCSLMTTKVLKGPGSAVVAAAAAYSILTKLNPGRLSARVSVWSSLVNPPYMIRKIQRETKTKTLPRVGWRALQFRM